MSIVNCFEVLPIQLAEHISNPSSGRKKKDFVEVHCMLSFTQLANGFKSLLATVPVRLLMDHVAASQVSHEWFNTL